MLFVSTSSIKTDSINEAVKILCDNGFYNIELSGGTEYYEGLEEDLLALKEKHELNLLCHNYFPPPKEHFVLNLASPDDSIYRKSLGQLKSALVLCKKLNAGKFAFHAGFFVDPGVNELDGKVAYHELHDKVRAYERFCRGFELLKKVSGSVKLYVENSSLPSDMVMAYGSGYNPFMLTHYSMYEELRKFIDFNVLLDVAHLKVSTDALGLDFAAELKHFMDKTDYLHISENSGKSDQHLSIGPGSAILEALSDFDLSAKTITLEIRGGIDKVKESYCAMQKAAV